MTHIQKQQTAQAIEAAIDRLGSAAKVATACGINQSYISQMRNPEKWADPMLKDAHWQRVQSALRVATDGWQLVQTPNYQLVWQACDAAKNKSMFLAISEKAGSGKSSTAREYAEQYATSGCHYFLVEHGEMNRGDFLDRLARSLGITFDSRQYASSSRKADGIIDHFKTRTEQRPLLIIDEADKLNDSALRFFISLYNALEGKVGCLILGTDNLKRRFDYGCQFSKNGFDELRSRFGGKFIPLRGFTRDDVRNIAAANGIDDTTIADAIFKECEPVTITVSKRDVPAVRDGRLIKRKIERELLRNAANNPQLTEDNQPMEAVAP